MFSHLVPEVTIMNALRHQKMSNTLTWNSQPEATGVPETLAWITYYSKTTKRRLFKDCTSNLFSQLMQTAMMIICTMMETY